MYIHLIRPGKELLIYSEEESLFSLSTEEQIIPVLPTVHSLSQGDIRTTDLSDL